MYIYISPNDFVEKDTPLTVSEYNLRHAENRGLNLFFRLIMKNSKSAICIATIESNAKSC